MSQYYGEAQWPGAGAGQPTWEHQTPPPPPARSGASSVIPREELAAFSHQIEEVERAIDNLVKSGKMFAGGAGPQMSTTRHGRGPSGAGPRHNSIGGEFGDARMGGGHPGAGLQNFYAAQRHQSSRGSNEAEQMMQAKRRLAAQRERELRNYHQEQQYNRTVLTDVPYTAKPDRALSPGTISEDDRRELIARQRGALYGEAGYADNGGFADESGAARSGAPGLSTGPSSHRGPSPLAYEYARGAEGPIGPQDGPGSRTNSNASPQSNPPSRGAFENAVQQATRTSNSSPGGSPPRQGGPPSMQGNTVAPIGTRPSAGAQAPIPALKQRSTTPLPSPLSHGFSAGRVNDDGSGVATSGPPSNPASASAEGYNRWGNGSAVWGKQPSGLGVQASVWG